MNEPDAHPDPQLEALFQREHTHLAAQPFLTSTLQRVAAERRRAVLVRRALQVAGLVAVIGAAPWLIDASVWISGTLDVLFVWVSTSLLGKALLASGLMAAAVVAALRGRVW